MTDSATPRAPDPGEVGRVVLVPVANPASARPLLACATRLAVPDEGRVELVTIVQPNATDEVRDQATEGLAHAKRIAVEMGVRTEARLLVADDPASGVLDAIAVSGASLVLMGWRGGSSTSDVFGRLIDTVVGRSTIPLAIMRPGAVPFQRVLLPLSADHLLPGGESGLGLAGALASRLREGTSQPTTLLRTGTHEVQIPARLRALGDRVHHDPRRTDQAVGAFARPDDVVVAAVAPTVSGLRAATTHLAWAAPEATLVVAVDVGPTREPGLERAVADAGAPAPPKVQGDVRDVRIVVTARMPDDRNITPEHLDRVLREAGTSQDLMAWWPAGDPRPHVRATVTVRATGVNAAIGAVMVAVHDAAELAGAEITYDVDRGVPASASTLEGPGVEIGPAGTADRPPSDL